MRQKRKARGRAERAALAAVAAKAGVEVEGEEPAEGDLDAEDDPPEMPSASGTWNVAEVNILAEAAASGSWTMLTVADVEEVAGEGDGDAEAAEPEAGEPEAEPEGSPQAAKLDEARFTALVEALLFASDKPLTLQRLRQLMRVSDTGRIQTALDRIQAEHADRGIVLSSVSGGYSFRTHSSFSPWVQQLIQGRPVRLSRAQLETLAIVAYRQPITRPEIDQIRGVDSGATLRLLLERHLIRILGKREEVGRPLLYGTTREFLDFFSLNDLRELPTLREYSELSDESRSMVEKLGMMAPPATGAPATEAAVETPAADPPASVLDSPEPDGLDSGDGTPA